MELTMKYIVILLSGIVLSTLMSEGKPSPAEGEFMKPQSLSGRYGSIGHESYTSAHATSNNYRGSHMTDDWHVANSHRSFNEAKTNKIKSFSSSLGSRLKSILEKHGSVLSDSINNVADSHRSNANKMKSTLYDLLTKNGRSTRATENNAGSESLQQRKSSVNFNGEQDYAKSKNFNEDSITDKFPSQMSDEDIRGATPVSPQTEPHDNIFRRKSHFQSDGSDLKSTEQSQNSEESSSNRAAEMSQEQFPVQPQRKRLENIFGRKSHFRSDGSDLKSTEQSQNREESSKSSQRGNSHTETPQFNSESAEPSTPEPPLESSKQSELETSHSETHKTEAKSPAFAGTDKMQQQDYAKSKNFNEDSTTNEVPSQMSDEEIRRATPVQPQRKRLENIFGRKSHFRSDGSDLKSTEQSQNREESSKSSQRGNSHTETPQFNSESAEPSTPEPPLESSKQSEQETSHSETHKTEAKSPAFAGTDKMQQQQTFERIANFEINSEEDALKLLELKSGSSEDDIKKQFRKMSLRVHPDKFKNDPMAEAAFKNLANARDKLLQQYAGAPILSK